MGYKITRLDDLPIDDTVNYYLVVIADDFETPTIQPLWDNFDRIARRIGSDNVIVAGLDQEGQWADDVALTYLGIDWKDYRSIFPALLITDAHPRNVNSSSRRLLMPLKDIEKRFETWDNFLSQVIRFVRGEDEEFLKGFAKKEDVYDATRRVFSFKPSVFGISVDVLEVIAQLRKARADTNRPLAG